MKKDQQKKIITEQLISFIENENLGIGSRLPSERNLTELLNVSRNTIREAIRELEARGRVKSKSGSGCFVTAHEDTANWVSLRGNTHPEVLSDHMEALEAIKPLIAEKAVMRATDSDIITLKQVIIRLSNAILNRDNTKITEAMLDFSKTLAEVSGNRFFILILQEMNLDHYILSTTLPHYTNEALQAIFKNRVEVINCFKNRDTDKAAALVKSCIEERHAFFEKQNP
ncbi:GntR family transcriptional regulator [Desulfoluna sp.]|uniref:FadR/GntR family transcriptional regulator n=1 Tax=Desulfoluna sp. TaxID=2045199 RepID=UPI00260A714D|nr:GntR family transcriptional regulator [Desulfoluna sp.]